MSQLVMEYDTTGTTNSTLNDLFKFNVSNPFYLLAPVYYYNFYASYLMPALALYCGQIGGVHNAGVGFNAQRLLPSISRGLTNLLFANGIDFSGDTGDYNFIKKWATRTKLLKRLKQAYEYTVAGGTSLLKINRSNGELFITSHRIDTYFVDVDASGKIINAKIFYDAIHNTVKRENQEYNTHYGICETRYFNKDGIPCVKHEVYRGASTLQTEAISRTTFVSSSKVGWTELPSEIRKYIKDSHPSIIIDKEQYLPFKDYLGCMLWTFTEDIPQIPNSIFGEPIGAILQSESLEYDQIKFFGRNEVDLARARALVPEEMWNNDDPDASRENSLSDRFYQKISSAGSDSDKITPIQFQLRAEQIRNQKEGILRDCALKLGLSASTIASFLNEGAGARTATEIVSERTKTDTWIKSTISVIRDDLDEFLNYIMRFYDKGRINIVFKCEEQVPPLDLKKVNSDIFSAGNMSPKRYVRDTYKNLSQVEQEEEIAFLEEKLAMKEQMQNADIAIKTQAVDSNLSPNENVSVNSQVDKS